MNQWAASVLLLEGYPPPTHTLRPMRGSQRHRLGPASWQLPHVSPALLVYHGRRHRQKFRVVILTPPLYQPKGSFEERDRRNPGQNGYELGHFLPCGDARNEEWKCSEEEQGGACELA